MSESNRRGGRWSRWPLLVGVLMGACQAQAKEMPEGVLPPLSGDDGYLLVLVDTDRALSLLRLDRQDAVFGTQNLRDIPKGVSARVLRVAAGHYRWQRLEAGGSFAVNNGQEMTIGDILAMLQPVRYDIDDAPANPTLHVQAGKLNYAGELRLRFREDGALSLQAPNRLEQGLKDLKTRHPTLPSLPLVHAIDGINDPWLEQRASLIPEHAGVVPAECPDPETLPKGEPPAAALYLAEEIEALRLSPDGRLVLELAYRNARYEAAVIDPVTGDMVTIYAGSVAVLDGVWAGPRRIVLGLKGRGHGLYTVAFTLAEDDLLGQKPSVLNFPADGYVVDPLPQRPDELLYAVLRPDHGDPMQVFRVDLSRKTLRDQDFRPGKRIDPKLENDRAWVADGKGELSIALVGDGESLSLVRRPAPDSPFETLVRLDGERLLMPVHVDDDGVLFALSNEGREQTELVRIDPSRPGVMESVHAVVGVDLADVIFDGADRAVIGVSYHEQGRPRSVFFDPKVESWANALAEAFPNHQPEFVDVNRRHGRAIVRVSGDTSPPSYYLFEPESKQAKALAVGAPWLSKVRFVPRRVLSTQNGDGHALQSLLAIPFGPGPHPLLVMPHGGPFYVQDVLRFDRDVQYWATRGFAVLQVNFRGSYGFGVQHLLGGFGGFGRQIEDDIEAAVSAALETHPELDDKRICAVGSSYGGYSALMLGLRDPERFRCVVAMAPPTDLPLLFSSSDWSSSEKSRSAMARAIGQPTDPALVQLSPLYRAERLTVPVMLIHGGNDRRVDYEHSARLARLLDPNAGHRLLRLDEMEHGPSLVQQGVCVMGSAEAFVRETLGLRSH